ncbi:hypothetical protein HY485_02260 [Candidatus Woesearchaeota archaeon]|nr:hypothetical protein [Candidatus Woesearchaeota archaeon]
MFDKKTAMSLFIAAIMILSVLGFVLVDNGGDNLKQKYGEHTFLRLPQGWRTTINGQQFVFNYFPEQLEDIKLPTNTTALKESPIIAFSYDPNNRYAEDLGALQYYFETTVTNKQRYVQRGLTNTTTYTTLPEITCKNATQQLPVIVLNLNTKLNATDIHYKNNCLTITADRAQELYTTTDRLIYSFLGIMQP